MKTPRFFYEKFGWKALMLLPFSALFFMASLMRSLITSRQRLAGKIVICIGNVTAGGAGKTPSCLFISRLLRQMGVEHCFLSRGYGRKSRIFMRVFPESSAEDVGDEPLMLARSAPTYVFSCTSDVFARAGGIKERVIVMDDGLQNPSIFKDFSFLVVDSFLGLGNGMLLPAGPLREPLRFAQKKVGCMLQIGEGLNLGDGTSVVLSREYELSGIDMRAKYLAFSGLASNQKFFNSLAELGLEVVEYMEFSDHFNYTRNDFLNITLKANSQNLRVVTTEKDFIKIPPDLRGNFDVLRLSLRCSKKDEEFLKNMLTKLCTPQ